MKNKIIISIANVYGSRSFTFNEFVKTACLYFFIFVIFVISSGWILTYILSKKIAHLGEIKNDYQKLISVKNDLELDVHNRETELINISDKIAAIEEMVGIETQNENTINSRLELAQITAAERLLMLRMLPNGTPIDFHEVTSHFGWRSEPFNKEGKDFHAGLDLRAPRGTPVFATADGIVEFGRSSEQNGYGKLLVLSHYLGFKSLYAHLDDILVNEGDFVLKGHLIAYSGNTGKSSGPHLHYEIRYAGMALNPINFIDWELKKYEEIFNKERKIKWDSLTTAIRSQWTLLEQLSLQRAQELQAKLN